jgi:hypothetical protein
MKKIEKEITLEILNWYAKMADAYKTMSDTLDFGQKEVT